MVTTFGLQLLGYNFCKIKFAMVSFVSQWCYLLADTKIYKSRLTNFCTSSHRFRQLTFQILSIKTKVKVEEYNFCNDVIP